jgi:hypothetical protein
VLKGEEAQSRGEARSRLLNFRDSLVLVLEEVGTPNAHRGTLEPEARVITQRSRSTGDGLRVWGFTIHCDTRVVAT